MATKYGNLIVREPFQDSIYPPYNKMMLYYSKDVSKEVDVSFRYTYITEPYKMESPHSHDFDQFFIFLGSADDLTKFPGEVEVYLGEGEEQEKHVINSTSVILIPRGVVHAPIVWKRVDKPLMFVNVVLSSDYVQYREKTAEGEKAVMREDDYFTKDRSREVGQ
jgi:hypothetical protein